MFKAYPQVLPERVKHALSVIRLLLLKWWKRKVTRGMFDFLEGKYGGIESTW